MHLKLSNGRDEECHDRGTTPDDLQPNRGSRAQDRGLLHRLLGGHVPRTVGPEVLHERFAAHLYPFTRRVITINNVDDKPDVFRMADAAVARGDCDEYVVVADALPRALEICGLQLRDIGRVLPFTNFLLVTVATASAEYVLHVAGDVYLDRPFAWVDGGVAKLRDNPHYFTMAPDLADYPGFAERTAERFDDPYWVNRSFSDQCFLGATKSFAAPIYSQWHPASNRYPMTNVGRIFEARVDAHMQNHDLLRLTDSRITYHHQSHTTQGSTYVKPYLWQRAAISMRYRVPWLGRKATAPLRRKQRGEHPVVR